VVRFALVCLCKVWRGQDRSGADRRVRVGFALVGGVTESALPQSPHPMKP